MVSELVVSNDNIIHVKFGPGGRRVPTPRRVEPQEPTPEHDRDPFADAYSMKDVAQLFGLTVGRLRHWERAGVVERTGRRGKRRFYTFQDLISVRAANGLLQAGVPLRSVRKSVEALRVSLPRTPRPLSSLRVVADGHDILVRDPSGTYDPVSGQLQLDFDIGELRDDVVRVLRRSGRPNHQRRAYEHYLDGCRLDEGEETLDEAEAAYRKAIELDPTLANAITNLGNLLFRRGQLSEAEGLYVRALRIDPEQPEAFYNLGFMLYERGECEVAARNFERAVRIDPGFADAHFNLAMALNDLGRAQEARAHWEAYIELDPGSPWAEIARRHLEKS